MQRLVLVEENFLLNLLNRRPQPPAVPQLREIESIEKNIHKTLHSDSPDREKISQVNNLIANRDTYVNHYEAETPISNLKFSQGVTGSNMKTPTSGEVQKWSEIAINSAPPRFQRNIKNLLEHVQSTPNLSWNELGEIIIDGQIMKGTNILDLSHGVARTRKIKPPYGFQEFVSALQRSNTPKEFLPNVKELPSSVTKLRSTEALKSSQKPDSNLFEETLGLVDAKKSSRGKGLKRPRSPIPLSSDSGEGVQTRKKRKLTPKLKGWLKYK